MSSRRFHDEESSEYTESDNEHHAQVRKHVCCGIAAALALAAVLALVLAQPIGRAVAQRVFASAEVSFDTIDLGVIETQEPELKPRIVGHVAGRFPASAKVMFTSATISAATPQGMTQIGDLTLPNIEVELFQPLAFDMQASVAVKDMQAFGQAGRQFINVADATWHVDGVVDITCWILGFIPLTLNDITVDKDVVLQGMDTFAQAEHPIGLKSLDRAEGEVSTLHLAASVNMYNPSLISACIPAALEFEVQIQGQSFGLARVNNLTLTPGANVVMLEFLLQKSQDNTKAIEDFISGYIRAESQMITVVGSPEASQDPFLNAIVDNLVVTLAFQPPQTEFIADLAAKVSLTGLKAEAKVFNPLPQAITIGQLDLSIFLPGDPRRKIFELDTKQSDSYLPGTALQPSQTTELNIGLSILGARVTDIGTLQTLIKDLDKGMVTVAVEGPVSLKIMPDFEMSAYYRADALTAKLGWCILCT